MTVRTVNAAPGRLFGWEEKLFLPAGSVGRHATAVLLDRAE